VRPCDDVSAAAARRQGSEFDERASATAWVVAEGLKQLYRAERTRMVESWGRPRRDHRTSMVADGGCDILINGAVVTGAVRIALLEWLPLSRADLAVCESGLFRTTPADALAFFVRPPTVWSFGEAAIAARLCPGGPQFEPERFHALERYAHRRLRDEHLARLREAAAKIERQLPVAGFQRASATVAAGCAVIANDRARCAAIAARQLALYAVSARVAREAPARGLSTSANKHKHATVCAC
jgi:hypothetical protein